MSWKYKHNSYLNYKQNINLTKKVYKMQNIYSLLCSMKAENVYIEKRNFTLSNILLTNWNSMQKALL